MSILQYLQESLSSKIIAYHGSGSTFDTFNNLKDGIWFTDNKDVAIEYTDPSYTAKNDRILYTVELSPKNPLIIDAEGRDFEGIIYPPMYMDTEWDSEYTDEDEAKAEALEWEFSTDAI